MIKLETDATIGSYASCIREKISIGNDLMSEGMTNNETVTLSKDVRKENSAPEIIAGRIKGSVIFQNIFKGPAPKIIAARSKL